MNDLPQVGLTIKTLSHLLYRSISKTLKLDLNTTQSAVQSHVLGYFAHSSRTCIEQRELQKHLGIRRSSVTNILKAMEKEGLIERRESEHDKRQKVVMLTEQAKEMCDAHLILVKQFESTLRQGISEEELRQFFSITEKMKYNLEREQCCEN